MFPNALPVSTLVSIVQVLRLVLLILVLLQLEETLIVHVKLQDFTKQVLNVRLVITNVHLVSVHPHNVKHVLIQQEKENLVCVKIHTTTLTQT